MNKKLLFITTLFLTACSLPVSPIKLGKKYVDDFFKVINSQIKAEKFCNIYWQEQGNSCVAYYESYQQQIGDRDIWMNWEVRSLTLKETQTNDDNETRQYHFSYDAQISYQDENISLLGNEGDIWLTKNTKWHVDNLIINLPAFLNYSI